MRKLLSKARTDVFAALSLARQIVTGNRRAKIRAKCWRVLRYCANGAISIRKKKKKEDGSPEELFDAKMKYMQLMDFTIIIRNCFSTLRWRLTSIFISEKQRDLLDEEKRCFGIFAAEAGKNEHLVSDWNEIIS